MRATLFLLASLLPALAQDRITYISGATLIDGNGGAPVADSAVIVRGKKIEKVGTRASLPAPAGATMIDAKGRYLIPGLIDTNVHLSLYGGTRDRYESLVRYYPREADIVVEAAQIDLRHGITTVRDSYGMLMPLVAGRDRIARGEAMGARILAAGNIVGWGGPYSITFSLTPQRDLTLFQEQMNDAIAQDAGENLKDLTPAELRVAINRYLDKGPDFLKFGGTSHFSQPTFIGFSPEAQRVMVEETHKRGKSAETHSTSIEGLRLSIEAGIDLIQHPEVLTPREMPDDLARLIRDRHIICSMLVSTITGEPWAKHVKGLDEAKKKSAEADKKRGDRPMTTGEQRQRATELGADLETRRTNAQKLIRSGCIVTPGTDSYWAAAPELSREPKPENQDHGMGTILAIEGLVELGMTPAQAITAGTKNGAMACKRAADFGTIEAGKLADLVLLDGDPLADIHNIRMVRAVFAEGKQVEIEKLPQVKILSR